jgi:conjugation system TraG family ATPase
MKNLSEILPLYNVEQEMILSKMGDITIAYGLTLPEIFTLSESDYQPFHEAWIKAIKVLPAGTVLHKQDWFVQETYKGNFEKTHSFLSHSSERFFHERAYLDHQCYLMLTMRPKGRALVNSVFSSLLRKHIVPVETLDPAFAKTFEGVCSQFIKILSDSGFVSCSRLTGDSLVTLVNRYLLLSDDGVRRDICFDGGIQVGEKHCALFSLGDAGDLPAYCGARIDYDKYSSDAVKFPIGFVSPLGQLLSCDHLYNQYLFIEEGADVMKRMERKRRRLQSLALYARENAHGLSAVEQFLNEAVANQYQPVKAHFNILAWTDDAGKIPEVHNRCSAALTQIDATPKIETVGAPQIHWAGIPGNEADFPVNDAFDTFSAQAACFFHLETHYRSSISPIGLRLGDRISGRPLHVDLSDEPMRQGIITNRNKIVIGPSGSGKSFLTNHLSRCMHETDSHIVVVDVGHSYKGLCELLQGYYFTYSEENPIRFNPFYVEGGGSPDTEKKESIKTLLVTLWKKDTQTFLRSEYVALSNAIQLYYEKDVMERDFNSFYAFVRDEFRQVLLGEMVRDQDFDIAGFLYVLKPYYKGGEFDYLLNAKENLDLLAQPFIVFELDNIKDHPILFPVVTIVIMEVFISKMRKLKGLRKMMLIEEAWKAIAKHGMAEYIKYLFKTARKHFGEAIVITQEIEDILSSDIIRQTIINNADCKILMDQSKYQHRFTEVQQLLGLTDKERALLLSVNRANDPEKSYKEVFISLGGRVSKVYRLEVSPEEYYTYTTEETEKLLVTNAVEKYGSMEAGIKSLTNQ